MWRTLWIGWIGSLALLGCRFDTSGVGSIIDAAPTNTLDFARGDALDRDSGDAIDLDPDGASDGAAEAPGPNDDAGADTDTTQDGALADLLPADSSVDSTPTPAGQWFQVDRELCPDFCTSEGKQNVPSPEGARCMSGEIRPQSGIDQGIDFKWGCWTSCSPMTGPLDASSKGGFCFHTGGAEDYDKTDRTVGCFCL